MQAKIIEILILSCAGFKKTEILKQLNISRITVHQVHQRLKASESLRDYPLSGTSQVISQEAIKKDLLRTNVKNDKTEQKKQMLVFSIQDVKKDEGKSLERSKKPLSAARVQKRLGRSTCLLNDMKKRGIETSVFR